MNRLTVTTPLGAMLLVAGDSGLRALLSAPPASLLAQATSAEPLLCEAARQLEAYFAGRLRMFDLPLDFGGLSRFAAAVLRQLQQVPYAATVGYGELAVLSGSPHAARAVGRVMAGNPWPVIIPCHRVVAADGSLGGYSGRGGVTTKQWLLDFERKVVAAG